MNFKFTCVELIPSSIHILASLDTQGAAMSYIQISQRNMILSVIVAVFVVSLAIPAIGAFAVTSSVTVSTARSSYTGVATINIHGRAVPMPPSGTVATVKITDPHGITVATVNAGVIHGVFKTSVKSGGSLWKVSGTYTVTATVNGVSGTTTFTYTA